MSEEVNKKHYLGRYSLYLSVKNLFGTLILKIHIYNPTLNFENKSKFINL